jgi:hypothetical protein
MGGKYQEVAKRLPKAEPKDGAFQERVNKAKDEYRGDRTPSTLATKYAALRREKDELAEKESALNLQIAAVEQLMWDAFETGEVESLSLVGGGSVSVSDDVTAAVEDRAGLMAWVKKQGLESLLTLPAPTLLAMTKERVLAGDVLPDGVRVGTYKKTNFRR